MGGMISIQSTGSFERTERFLKRITTGQIYRSLSQYGAKGKAALAAATPVKTGLAAGSWSYQVSQNRGGWELSWSNTDVETGFPVAIMIQYGHGTGTGGYVAGRDYINPVIRPLFDQIADSVWKEVTSA